ncbi:Glycosyltransferase involved in cell wall bisynthesis [Nocardiopsis flavescens]|uniref:Glycosyltransferase involved in cell wall bisynthesis n=2 Tax=Nocardiopsis flavescens TaxID=758803 RepID=A0A1M6FQR5_9ACTN|nr:Glycosyltransferase involved in cell wall bisynthesis [Nocardiopsis flavescens]
MPRPRTRRLRAATFTASTAWRHLRSDPARTPLLALRLMPGPVRRAARGAAVRVGGSAGAYALWDEGRRAEAREAVLAAASGAGPRTLGRLVAACLAAGDAGTARELIERLPPGPVRDRAVHRTDLATGRAVAASPSPSPVHHGITLTRDAPTRPEDTVNARRPEAEAGERLASPPGGAVDGSGVRVLHLVTNALPHTNAGYTQRTHRIAVAQREAGMDVHVVSRVGHPVDKGSGDARTLVRVDGIPYHRLLPWTAPANPEEELAAGLRLASELVERLRPNVLHAASNHRNARLALALGHRFGLPVVYEVRGFLEESWLSRDPSRSVDDAFYRSERARETECMLAADLVVTLGEAMRADIEARGVPSERLLVVPNAVDESFLEPLPAGTAVREEWGIGPGEFVVGTTTSCYGYEGLDTLLEAVARMRGAGEAAHALVVGDGPELASLRARAAELGLAGAAHFPGRVPAGRVREHHAAMDVFAVPRRDDRVCRVVTPLKPVEAMAGRLPVVASDLPALREIVEPGVTGELIPPGESAGLADVLTKLAYSRERREAYGLAGRSLIGANRTWTGAVYRYDHAYRALIRKMSEPGQIP